eukprot:112442_1
MSSGSCGTSSCSGDCSSWSTNYGTISCGYDSEGCHNGDCHKVESEDSQGYAYIGRTTNIAAYSAIQIELDIGSWGMESGDECNIYFEFDGDWVSDTYKFSIEAE